MIETLLARLQDLAGQNVTFGAEEVTGDEGLIDPEPRAITRAIPKRRAEFAAGRRAARHAMKTAGLAETAIPQGEKRAPLWPEGLRGSITHDNGLALACIARADAVTRLGLDLAEASDFPEHLRNEILRTPEEQRQSGLDARITFSAKETVFKAFYPEVGSYFGFDAVEVAPALAENRFSIRLRRTLGACPAGTEFQGAVIMLDNRLVTLLAVPA